jgi:acyl-CoA thioester hydrolase
MSSETSRKHPAGSHGKLIYTAKMPVRWGDMDALGHVNNTVYFRFMEQCRIEWLEEAVTGSMSGGQGPVIVNANCTFLRQLKYPADIVVEMYAGALGRTSVETTYIIKGASDPEIIYAEGGAKIVWVDFAKEKSTPLPEALCQLLTGL